MCWDKMENTDFKSDCILGFFRNHPIDTVCRIGEKFGCLTAVKDISACKDGARYEENYFKRWRHFRPATNVEIKARTYTEDK